MRTPSSELRVYAFAALVVGLSLGCTSFGPGTVPDDRFDFNAAIARSRDEQMLLNIVRMRYLEMADFLTVSSVIAGYTYEGGIGVAAQKGFGGFDDNFGASGVNLGYSERPTITYTPLSGEEFARRMLRTIPIEIIFSLGQAGWPTDVLFRIAVQRIGEAENMAFGHVEDAAFQEEARKLETYDRVIRLVQRLQAQGAFEVVQPDGGGEEGPPTFRFARAMNAEQRALAEELKGHLGLELRNDTFRVTDRITHRDAEEIVIQTRSLLSILSFLSRGVEVSEAEEASNRVQPVPDFVRQVVEERGPLRVRCQEDRPEDPHVAIRYRDRWYYVDGRDLLSKRTFITLLTLFELLAPSGGGAAPLLTLPAG